MTDSQPFESAAFGAGNAALLIDLENFYIGRESLAAVEASTTVEEGFFDYDFRTDLEALASFAKDLVGDRRMTVSRAYANFNVRRPGSGEYRWDYYLQPQTRVIMENGIEPVQVFRFPGGGNKNAVDMRLAMDATALMGAGIETFVLVTGDADFIPLSIELRRCGAVVNVVGVRGRTKKVFERFCDRFEYFEDLFADYEQREDESRGAAEIAELLRDRLGSNPMAPDEAWELVQSELGASLEDMELDGPDSLVERLRSLGPAVGVAVCPQGGLIRADADGAPRSARLGHTATLYRTLLRRSQPRIYVLPREDWLRIGDVVFAQTSPDGGDRPRIYHADLQDEVTDDCIEEGMVDAGKKVSSALFQLFKAGCFHCADDGVEEGRTDFHWSQAAILDPAIESAEALRERAEQFLVGVLRERLERFGKGEIEDCALAEMLGRDTPDGPELTSAAARPVHDSSASGPWG